MYLSYNIYFQCCLFRRKSFHMPVRKRRQIQLRVSNVVLLLVVFKRHHGSERVKARASLLSIRLASRSLHAERRDPVVCNVHKVTMKVF